MNEPSHTSEHFSGPFKRPLTRRLNTEIPLCSAAPLSTRIADPRRDIPLLFQPIEGGVDGAERHIMAGPLRDFSPDRYAIGVLAESGHREEDDPSKRPSRLLRSTSGSISSTRQKKVSEAPH